MFYEERISFDGGNLWYQLKYHRSLHQIKLGWKTLLIWLGAALVGFAILTAIAALFLPYTMSTGDPAPWGANIAVFLMVLVITSIGWIPGVLLIYLYFRNLRKARMLVSDANEKEVEATAEVQELVIHDVQRKDERTITSTSTYAGTGVGINIGFGLLAGAAGGSSVGHATSHAVIGWQFYTSLGIILLPDDAYALWLSSGKPSTALYSIKNIECNSSDH